MYSLCVLSGIPYKRMVLSKADLGKIKGLVTASKQRVTKPRGRKSRRPKIIGGVGISTIPAPLSVGQVVTSSYGGFKSVEITHREFVCSLAGVADEGACTSLDINPGLPAMFKWLSVIARGFESYYFKGLCFHYVPRCGATTAGHVTIGVDYDPEETAPGDRETLMVYQDCVSGCSWQPLTMKCSRANLDKRYKEKFVRETGMPREDYRNSDPGTLHCWVGGNDSTVPVGELWVSYSVCLMTPEIPKSYGGDAFKCAPTILAAPFANVTPDPLNQGIVSVHNGTDIWLERAGRYLLTIKTVGTTLTYGNPTYTAVGAAVEIIANYAKYDGIRHIWQVLVDTTTAVGKLTGFTYGSLAATLSECDIVATMLTPGLY